MSFNFASLFTASTTSAIAASVRVSDEIVAPALGGDATPLMHFKSEYDERVKGNAAEARFIKATFGTFFTDFCPNRLGVTWEKGEPVVATIKRYAFNGKTGEYGPDAANEKESNLRILNNAATETGIEITSNACPLTFRNKRDDKGNAFVMPDIEKAIKDTVNARNAADKAQADNAKDANEKEVKAHRMETALSEKIAATLVSDDNADTTANVPSFDMSAASVSTLTPVEVVNMDSDTDTNHNEDRAAA